MQYPASEEAKWPAAPERTSEILSRLAEKADKETITVGSIVDALYDRSFGVVMILFALPNTVIPIAWILGTPILLFAVQMVMGRQEPWLPEFMRRRAMNQETFSKVVSYAVRYLRKIESALKPRWNFLTTDTMERIIGVYIIFLTLVLMIPVVPFGNALPAFGISIISAGLLEKDGAAIVVGALVGLVGAAYVFSFLGGVWVALKLLIGL